MEAMGESNFIRYCQKCKRVRAYDTTFCKACGSKVIPLRRDSEIKTRRKVR